MPERDFQTPFEGKNGQVQEELAGTGAAAEHEVGGGEGGLVTQFDLLVVGEAGEGGEQRLDIGRRLHKTMSQFQPQSNIQLPLHQSTYLLLYIIPKQFLQNRIFSRHFLIRGFRESS